MSPFDDQSRPQSSDGGADWERIFEHPEQGLINLVTQADGDARLRNCVIVVIEKLLVRVGDEVETARLTAELDALISQTTELDAAKQAVTDFLRGIKRDRIEAARRQTVGGDRRRKRAAKKRRELRLAAAGLAAIFVIAFSTTVGVMFLGDDRFLDEEDEISALKAAPGPASDAAHDADTEAHGEVDANAEPESIYPLEVAMPFMVWSITPSGGERARILYQSIFHVADWNQHTMACRNEPRLKEVINLVFNLMHPNKRMASEDELERAADRTMDRMETYFGKFAPNQLTLISKDDLRFDHNPPPCEPPPLPKMDGES